MSENRYFAVFDRQARPWDPYDPDDLPLPDCGYFGGVFRALERHWEGEPLTVYMTKDTTSLPSYGPGVVSVLLNEEWFRTPAYTSCILAVLRNLPGRPWFPWGTLAPPSLTAVFALANYLRVLGERARSLREGEAIRRARGWPPPRQDNTVDVPLGYYRQPTRPIKPIEERTTDAYFGGSLLHDINRKERWKQLAKQVVGNPKQVYRKRMLSELERVRSRHPELNAKVTLTGEFSQLGSSQVTDYATDMMDARVALVPRGTAAESYRLFEAWRYGCIVLCEPLPPRPFLEGAPVITLGSWGELEPVLTELLADPARQRALHEASLRWWQEVCSEEAVGRRLAAQLRNLTSSGDQAAAPRTVRV
jgi:hypothetical protein